LEPENQEPAVRAEPLPPVLSDDISRSPPSTTSSEAVVVDPPTMLHIQEPDECDVAHQQNFSKTTALDILLGVLTSQSPASPSESQGIPRLWLTARIESYLATFHPRWLVLHAPVLNETTDSIQLISTVVMIDLWLHGEAKLKPQILRLHECLVRQLYKELVINTPKNNALICHSSSVVNFGQNESDLDPTRSWPADLYQLALLNVIFAFETGVRLFMSPNKWVNVRTKPHIERRCYSAIPHVVQCASYIITHEWVLQRRRY
jgi:hypothetical protein